jgi:hypothetical protein
MQHAYSGRARGRQRRRYPDSGHEEVNLFGALFQDQSKMMFPAIKLAINTTPVRIPIIFRLSIAVSLPRLLTPDSSYRQPCCVAGDSDAVRNESGRQATLRLVRPMRQGIVVPVSNPEKLETLLAIALSATAEDDLPPRVAAFVRRPAGGIRSGLRGRTCQSGSCRHQSFTQMNSTD